MCIVTREVKDEGDLLRFVCSPEGDVVPDLQRKLPGRGVWVSLDRAKVAEAVKRNVFSRSFGQAAKADDTLADRVAGLLRKQAVSHLSLARKAGEAVCGFTKVEDALGKGPVRLLLHAVDSSADGARKIDKLAGPRTIICGLFLPAELDLAFGRANVIHAAVADGALADRLVFYVRRFAQYEGLAFTGL